MTKSDEVKARCAIYAGAFAWVLRDVRALKPFPVKGQLGIRSALSMLISSKTDLSLRHQRC